jgi:hypothetical protein
LPTPSSSIAVAQTVAVAGDVHANLDGHLRLARIAAGEGAEIVALPEMSLTGYGQGLAEALTFSEEDPRLHIGAFILRPGRLGAAEMPPGCGREVEPGRLASLKVQKAAAATCM